MSDINIYNNSEIILKRQNFKMNYYIIVMSSILSLLVIVFCFYKYHPYYNLKATILLEENQYQLKTLVLEENMSNINNNYLIISDNQYKYKIENIGKEYLIDDKYNKYYEVFIKTKLEKNLLINNNIIDINIKLPKTTLLKEFLKKIKKGMK